MNYLLADISHEMPSLTFSDTKKTGCRLLHLSLALLGLKPFLSTDTAHKRINVWKMLHKDVKFTENVYSLNFKINFNFKI